MAQNVIINGVVYSEVPITKFPKSDSSGDALFYDTSDADVTAGDIPTGKTAYGASGSINGSMPVNGDVSGTINTKAGTVSIPAGKTTGGTVSIAQAEQDKIIAGNIRSGVSILGQPGASTVVDTTIASNAAAAGDIRNGKKGYVNGSLVEGQLTVPVISQDSSTKILSIS